LPFPDDRAVIPMSHPTPVAHPSRAAPKAAVATNGKDVNVEEWVRRAKYWQVLLFWIAVLVVFATIFALLSLASGQKSVTSALGHPSSRGALLESVVFSFGNGVLLGYGNVLSVGLARVFVIIELFLALLIYGVLLSRLFLQTMHIWPAMFDNAKNKKVNTVALMFSIFRHDVDLIMHKLQVIKGAGGKTVPAHLARDLEAASEEFYLGLLEVEMLLSEPHGHKLATHHVILLLHNVEASLQKLKELLHAMGTAGITYASKTFVFNLKYTTDLTEKIGSKYKSLERSHGERAEEYSESITALREEIKRVL
jgi:hypothetical protein